jgi:hypothetical protein
MKYRKDTQVDLAIRAPYLMERGKVSHAVKKGWPLFEKYAICGYNHRQKQNQENTWRPESSKGKSNITTGKYRITYYGRKYMYSPCSFTCTSSNFYDCLSYQLYYRIMRIINRHEAISNRPEA